MSEPAAPRTNPALLWGLVATLAATAWALWWPGDAPPVVTANDSARVPPGGGQAPSSASAAAALQPAMPASAAASGVQAVGPLSLASRDPFHPEPPPAPPPATQAAAPSPKEEPPPPPPPPPPPQTYKLMGRMLSPEGKWMVFLQDGAQIVQATQGLTLPNGYVVESVTATEVRLHHPLMEQPVSLPVPEDNAP